MKKTMITMAALASALVLLFPGVAGAHHPVDPGRTDTETFEFYALGQGDVGGFCITPPPDNPPELGPLGSCVESAPSDPSANAGAQEDHVEISVTDAAGNPVYFTVQQDGNPNFGFGCGTISSHGPSAHHASDTPPPGMFPILGAGAGGGQAPPVQVFPWFGPGVDDALDPGGDACVPGSVNPELVNPGTVGTVVFKFHNDVAP